MAAEPIVIYSHKIDAAGVLQLLRQMSPGLQVKGPPDNWQSITITEKRGLLKRAATLSFGHDRAYYTGDGWPRQMNGMMGYFARFPENERTGVILSLINSFRFALTTFPVPTPELELHSNDSRLKYVFAVVKHLDGVIFTPSGLWDATGTLLYGPKGFDPEANMPRILREVTGPRSERPRSEGGELPDPEDAPPPTPQRVAQRACAMAAVCARALLEMEDTADPAVEQTLGRVRQWIADVGLRDELEPDEAELLHFQLGAAPQQQALDATWRLEGLAVLAWALGFIDLPPHDVQIDPGKMLPAMGFLNVDRTRALLANPTLRPSDELKALQDRMFALHWRLRNFRLKPEAMNFREFARTAWFGPLDITGLPLAEDDLAIVGEPISRADQNAVMGAMSSAQERHQAINWLCGGTEVYSETDTPT